MKRPRSLLLPLAVVFLVAAGWPRAAHAVGWTARLEVGFGGPLERPQRDLFVSVFAPSLRVGFEPVDFFDIHLVGALIDLHPSDANPNMDSGLAWMAGGGVRFKRPAHHGLLYPWLDAELGYVRTGPLNRFGFSLGAGLGFGIPKTRRVRLGIYVRYAQIVTTTGAPYDDTDAKVMHAGLFIEVGSVRKKAANVSTVATVDPNADTDHDGISDARDRCPAQPEDKDGFQDDDGCPDPDNDGDGVADVVDRCPLEPEDHDGFEDQDGCPELDNDKDGVLDKDDGCPNLPGAKETGGCPDRDGDQLDDQHDECPDVPGPVGNKGCPEYKNVKITANKLELAQKIFFAHDLTRILPRSFPLLDEVAKVLQDHDKLNVRIEGHTDARGSAEHNRVLSLGRAEAVRTYLVARGIAVTRLEAKGYGPELPIDSNATVAGRENNRRVEFVIMNAEGSK